MVAHSCGIWNTICRRVYFSCCSQLANIEIMDENVINRYVRIDMQQHTEALRPFLQTVGMVPSPEGWEEGLTSEEFLMAAKQMLRKKFEGRNFLFSDIANY